MILAPLRVGAILCAEALSQVSRLIIPFHNLSFCESRTGQHTWGNLRERRDFLVE
jgi:hypothetical protein